MLEKYLKNIALVVGIVIVGLVSLYGILLFWAGYTVAYNDEVLTPEGIQQEIDACMKQFPESTSPEECFENRGYGIP